MAELTASGGGPGGRMARVSLASDCLAAFLREQSRRSPDWRPSNCLLLPADWLVHLGHPDPAGPWRAAAHDPAAVLAASGGVLDLAVAAMVGFARLGDGPTHAVRRGDVGVVRVLSEDGPALAGGICTGRRWAVRGPKGLWIGRAEVVAAWRIGEANHG